MNISIIGGDSRIAKLAEMYAEEKCNVYTYGLEKYFNYCCYCDKSSHF